MEANSDAALDVINFAITGAGVHTIAPGSALPTITNPVTIDGYALGSGTANSLAIGTNAALTIELNGANAPTANGLEIVTIGSTVRGLVINGFSNGVAITGGSTTNVIEGNFIGTNAAGTAAVPNTNAGVLIAWAPSNTIGGATDAARNLISGNTNYGIQVELPGSIGNVIEGNLIGTKASGLASMIPPPGPTRGIFVWASASKTLIKGNVVSGNGHLGILLSRGFASSISVLTTVQDNLVGLGADGTTAVGNGDSGIQLSFLAPGIDSKTVISGNSIANNANDGIAVIASAGVTITGNRIGTTSNGLAAAPNGWRGVFINRGSNLVTVGTAVGAAVASGKANTIANAPGAFAGVLVDDAIVGTIYGGGLTLDNTIRGNSIRDNGGKGIELRSGGNTMLPAPVVTSVSAAAITGTTTCVAANCIVDVYTDAADEGRVYLGSATPVGVCGDWKLDAPFGGALLTNVNATATDPAGNTSEFSTPGGTPCGEPFTVTKQYSDSTVTPVDVTLTCNGATVTPTTAQATPATFTVSGASAGADCTAVEAPIPAGYSPSGCVAVALPASGCTITNTLNSQTFTVSKVYSPTGPTTPVNVTLTCNGATVSPATPQATPATFTVSGAGSDCTAVESPVPAGYSPSGCVAVVLPASGCTITNTLNSQTFTVSKVYSPTGPTTPVNVTLTCNGATVTPTTAQATPATFTVSGASAGSDCTAVESPIPAGYSPSGCVAVALPASGCTITNTLNSHTFTVSKVYSPAGPTIPVSIKLVCAPSGTVVSSPLNAAPPTSPAVFTVTGYTLDPDCTATELNPPTGYTTSPCVAALVSVSGCTITNTLNTATLTLVKVVVGGGALASAWTLSATGPTPISGPGGASGQVGVGTYDLSESGGPSGYSDSAWVCNNVTVPTAQITLTSGQNVDCVITNTRDTATLTLSKAVIGGGQPVGAWTLYAQGLTPISGPGGATGQVTVGVYTLSESATPSGYSASAWACTGGVVPNANSEITLTVGQNITCTITNTRQVARLTLKKVVVGSPPLASPSAWTLCAQNGPNPFCGVSGIGNQVGVGTYTLSESGPSGYAASAWVCTGGPVPNANSEITLTSGQNVTCTITNTRVATVTIAKYIDKNPASDVPGNPGYAKGLTFQLTSPVGGSLAPNSYHTSLTVNAPSTFKIEEDVTRDVNAQCGKGAPFKLIGYSYGATEGIAKVSPVHTTPSYTINVTGDLFVIVWNETCGSVTIEKWIGDTQSTAVPASPANATGFAFTMLTPGKVVLDSNNAWKDVTTFSNALPSYLGQEQIAGDTHFTCDGAPFAITGYAVIDPLGVSTFLAGPFGPSLTAVKGDWVVRVYNKRCLYPVTIVKYIDGKPWDGTTDHGTFPFVSTPSLKWSNGYTATVKLTAPFTISVEEDLTGPNVKASCSVGVPYRRIGYTTGTSIADAESKYNPNKKPSAAVPKVSNTSTNNVVIVWNETCARFVVEKYIDGVPANDVPGTLGYGKGVTFHFTTPTLFPGTRPIQPSVGYTTGLPPVSGSYSFTLKESYKLGEVLGECVGAKGAPFKLRGYTVGTSATDPALSIPPTNSTPPLLSGTGPRWIRIWNETCAKVTVVKYVSRNVLPRAYQQANLSGLAPGTLFPTTSNLGNFNLGDASSPKYLWTTYASGPFTLAETRDGVLVAGYCNGPGGPKFALVGYTTGQTLTDAINLGPPTGPYAPPNLYLTGDLYVIVWNLRCY